MGILWGALAGFMSTLIQVGTPPYQIHILPQRLDKLGVASAPTVDVLALLSLVKICAPTAALDSYHDALLRPNWHQRLSHPPPIVSASGWCTKPDAEVLSVAYGDA